MEQGLLDKDRNQGHDGYGKFGPLAFACNQVADGIVADSYADDGHGNADANGNQRLEAAVPVGVFCVWWRIPEMAPHDDGNIRDKIGCAVDSVGDEGL